MRRALLVAGPSALAILLSGCGSLPPPPLGHAQLVARADAVCATGAAAIAALPTPRSTAAAASFAAAAALALETELKSLRKLRPAAADADLWTRFLASLQAAVDAMENAADAARRGDGVALGQALRDGRDGSQGAASTALGLGLAVCGRSVVPGS